MNWRTRVCTAGLFFALLGAPAAWPQTAPGHLTVHADQPGARISSNFYGLMTEEINHAYDGGLYGELIQNRTLKDDASTPVHWSLVQAGGGMGSIALDTGQPINSALTTCLKLNITVPGTRVAVANDGYWGIPVRPNTTYRASFYAKASVGFSSPLTVSIERADGTATLAQAVGPVPDSYWRKYTVTLQTGNVAPSENNVFIISAASPGTVWLNLVSLFPPTYKDRPNGNRIDLMDKMAAMSPSFLRFPGGNYLDPGHYQWKITVGPLEERPGHPGAWSYRSSDGLGLLEFLLWCEDLNMEPVLGVSDGRDWLPATSDVGPLVQDALDEIEYITGDTSTYWGAHRAADGHPAPFPLRFVEVGNEDFFDSQSTYNSRFTRFFDAIKARYPQIQVIATRRDVTSRRPDLVDDHIYSSPSGMRQAAHNYDGYSRTAPKVFVGEWATTYGSPTPTFTAALSDAAYLTGLERNADVVQMAAYAPLLVNVNPGASQWGTNLIGYDALNSYGSPSYYMQTMFSHNRGDVVLPVDITPQTITNPTAPHGAIGLGTWSTQAEFRNVSVTNGTNTLYQNDLATSAADWTPDGGTWQIVNGALQQSSTATDCRITVGDTSWTDYTLSLQARKISGAEGFLIMFHVQDHDNFVWWNLGGWGNTRTALERSWDGSKTQFGNSNITIATGQWYDIKIVVQGSGIQCYLNGSLVTSATDIPPTVTEPVFAAASRELSSGDVIMKVVNVSPADQQLQVDVPGAGSIAPVAAGQILTGNPGDVNSLDAPTRVAPQALSITNASASFVHTFPAYSVSVLRLKQGGAFTMADAMAAVRIAGGLNAGTPADSQRLDAVTGSPAGSIDLRDAVRVFRMAMGLDA